MSEAAKTIAAILDQRKSWVEVEPGKRVQILRPAETEMVEFFVGGKTPRIRVTLDQVQKCTVGWEGILMSDLLGAAVASADPVPFDSDLWVVVSADRTAWVNKVVEGLKTSILEYAARKEDAEKK